MNNWQRNIRYQRPRRSRRKAFLLVVIVFGLAIFGISRWLLSTTGSSNAVPPVVVVEGQPASPSLTLPASAPDLSVRKVVESVLRLWVEALITNNYTVFHQTLSSSWRSQDSPEKLVQAYQKLSEYKDALNLFPNRGQLVLMESGPFVPVQPDQTPAVVIRENVGPESPWIVRGEWRTGKTTLSFTLTLSLEEGQWRPAGLLVAVYR